MRFAFSIVALAAFTSSIVAAPTPAEAAETPIQATERLMFKEPIAVFITARNAQFPRTLDWTSDGCSSSPDNPFGFDFLDSCYRHDFGYRNFKAQNRFDSANKLRIDNNFQNDLYNQCNNQSFTSVCKDLADVYYAAVRAFGNKYAGEVLAASIPAAKAQIAKEVAKREAARKL